MTNPAAELDNPTEGLTPNPSYKGAAAHLLVATLIGGGAAYGLTILAGVRLGAAGYAPVAVFLSALYLLVAALAGIQSEVARASRRRDPNDVHATRPVARNFALVGASCVALLVVATSRLWMDRVFPSGGYTLIFALAIGASAYVFVATLAGILYGLSRWKAIAVLIAGDGIVRLLLTGVVLWFTTDTGAIAGALVAPFVVVPLIVWPLLRPGVGGEHRLDVGYRRLSWNVARTLVAATASAVLISGFPLLVAATSRDEPANLVAATMLAINLTRAPLIVVAMSFQSFLVVRFRQRASTARPVAILIAALAVASVALGALAMWLGPAVLEGSFGPDFKLDARLLAAIVASGGAVAAMCVTGPAVLARGLHGSYAAGWSTTAAGTIAALLLPYDLSTRVTLAVLVAPLPGLAVHVAALVRDHRRSRPR